MSPLKIYNTLTRTKEEFVPRTPGEVGIYSCGVTVYDLSHIGHARSVMVYDVICRYLAFKGYRVTFVRNFTDVDDKIIRRAQQEGVSASEISERYIAEFRTDMHTLGVLPSPSGIVYHDPKATDFVPEMVALIERLIVKGFAYVLDGDVYFEISRFPRYGRLSGKNLDELLAGARVDVDERKRDPRDFALWKTAKPGEPAWPSPWGPGRPGWHVECSVMATRYLGQPFDIHGGGTDLIFPHHECEIAQSEAATGTEPFARYWVHNGLVNLGAEKMSKSLGNTLTIRELVKRHDPDALRLWLLGTHYRSSVEFAEEHIRIAGRTVEGLRDLIGHAQALSGDQPVAAFPRGRDESIDRFTSRVFESAPSEDWTRPRVGDWFERFQAAMDDDFNTPEALAVLFSIRSELRGLRDKPTQTKGFVFLVRVLLTLANALGLFLGDPAPRAMPAELRAKIEALVGERDEARRQRNWARSDALRAELQGLGVVVEDTSTGTRWSWKGA